MELLLDISSKLQATEYYIQLKQKLDAKAMAHSKEVELRQSPPSQSSCLNNWACIFTTGWLPPATIADLAEEVRVPVARRLCKASIPTISFQLPCLLLDNYLAIMETVKPALKLIMSEHLKELMADTEVYGWVPVRAYHVVWLQQIENGRAKWSDVNEKLEFCRALVWHAVPPTSRLKQAGSAPRPKKAAVQRSSTTVTMILGTKACSAFNKEGCTQQEDHRPDLHTWAYCMASVNIQCVHPKRFVTTKSMQ